MTQVSRRAFLWTTGTWSLVAACGASATTGPDAATAADAASDAAGPSVDANACTITRNDALGPFHQPGAPSRTMLADVDEPGERLVLRGRILGPDCATPLAGALVDLWQADATGTYHGGAVDSFRLRGQVLTDADGRFEVSTVMPGNYQTSAGAWRPAHIHAIVTHPGHGTVTTQIYFVGDPYLPPNDSCISCTSEDQDRWVARTGDALTGWTGEVTLVLAAA